MTNQNNASFWSGILKDLTRLSYSQIPSVDGPFSRYLPASKDLTLRPKTVHYLASDLPPNFNYGYYSSSHDESAAAGSAVHIYIPYVEIRGPVMGSPIATLGNIGDVYIVEGAKKPSYWIRGPEKWCHCELNTLMEHPFLRNLQASYRYGTVVWESIVKLGGGKSLRLETKCAFSSPSRGGYQNPTQPLLPLVPAVPGSATNDEVPAVTSAPKTSHASPEKASDATVQTAMTSPDRHPLRSALKNRPRPEPSTPERKPKRVRTSGVDNEARDRESGTWQVPKQNIAVTRKRTTTTSLETREEHSISVATTIDTTSRATAVSDIEALQLLVQHHGDEIKTLTEELANLRKRNATLCTENANSQQEREKFRGMVKCLEDKGKKDVATRKNTVSRLRGTLFASNQTRKRLSEENADLHLKIVETEGKRGQAERMEASLQDVNEGLRLTLLVVQAERDKLKKRHREDDRKHAEECSTFESVIRDLEQSVQRSIAYGVSLRREKEDIQAELQDALVISKGFQRDVFEERARCTDLRDEVARLETQIKSLLSQYATSQSLAPSSSSGTLRQRLDSLPKGIGELIGPLVEAVYNAFSDMEERLKTETERAVSATEMFTAERNAHAESRKTGEVQLSKVSRERDAAIQTSLASERDLAALRKDLARLACPR